MRIIKFITLFIVILFAIGCNKEDSFKVSPQTLAQTVWNAEIVYYSKEDNVTGNDHCVVEFLTESEGKYNEPDMNIMRQFTYEVDRAIITIDSGIYTTLNGVWHIIQKSEQQITLQGYSPNVVITLDRIL